MIHYKIKSAFSEIFIPWDMSFFGQFWVPVSIGGRRLLSTSGQPFAVGSLSSYFAMYRLYSEKYKYNIDANNLDFEPDHMIYWNRQTSITINGLELAKDHIKEALKVVCESHNLILAQVWIAYENKTNVPLSFSLEDTQTKRLLAIKLAGYFYAVEGNRYDDFEPYFRFGDVTPRAIGEEFPLVTLQDYESHYTSKHRSDMLMDWGSEDFYETSGFAICLRSSDTSDYKYVFEFIWIKHSNYINLLEALLLTLKRCLPTFKFASGEEIGNELDVHNGDNKSEKFKIFQGKRSMVVDYIAPSKVMCKTTPKVLPRQVIEKQFGKTMKDAAKNLNVSKSTLKRKLREHGIWEWPGPNFIQRKKNDSSIIQINPHEEDNRAIQVQSTISLNQNSLTIKAELADDIIKFRLPILQANFVTVEKEIGMKFNLSLGTYQLKYRDEIMEWILLRSDEEMSYCIESSRKIDQNEVRLRVVPSTQPISGPSCSNGICST
ncbi:putative transcription factor Nin-like family [Helianthus annuus]|nr:putative transcription factor Nin-like family [Helianthus annuus]